jgi:ribosomal protein S24E
LKLKVISENYNSLMKRKEINIEISHEKTGTPDRISLRESIINKFKSNKDNSYIIKLETDTGTNRSLCYAEIYDDYEYARNVVPKYIIERNFPSEKEEKPEKEVKEEKP